jgi:hypothetical protein
MLCQDAAFVGARCRIEINEGDTGPGPRYSAVMYVLEDDDRVLRPIAFESGQRAEIKASSDALALASAISYLESRFGAQTEYAHQCVGSFESVRVGEPFVIDTSIGPF